MKYEETFNEIRRDFHWKTQPVRLGCAAETSGFGGEVGLDWGRVGLELDAEMGWSLGIIALG